MERHLSPASRLASRIFWTFVGGWVVLLLIGMIWRLPYLERGYGSITLPLYFGVMLSSLAAAGLWSGSIWRGRHRSVERGTEPGIYWAMLLVTGVVGMGLLAIGLYHLSVAI